MAKIKPHYTCVPGDKAIWHTSELMTDWGQDYYAPKDHNVTVIEVTQRFYLVELPNKERRWAAYQDVDKIMGKE